MVIHHDLPKTLQHSIQLKCATVWRLLNNPRDFYVVKSFNLKLKFNKGLKNMK